MYARILVPLDGSDMAEQVLPYVRQIGKSLRVPVEFLRVIEPMNPDMEGVSFRPSTGYPTTSESSGVQRTTEISGPRGPFLDQIVASLSSHAQDYLEHLAAVARHGGLDVSTSVHEGMPAYYIVEEAHKESSTLIAMTTHGRSGVTRWLLGSVTDKVLHATSNPLLLVSSRDHIGASADVKLTTVIVPLDGSDLAEQVLPHAVSLANALSLKVLLVRVTPLAADYYRYTDYSVGAYYDYSAGVDAAALEYLHGINQRLQGQQIISVEERLLHGNPAAAIVDLAKEVTGTVVAMTTHGRSGVGRWVLGSVADRVVCHCGNPVLIVRSMASIS